MAREANSGRELPSPEARRQMLLEAGMILDEARELMARLDRHETTYPRTICDRGRLIWEAKERGTLEDLRDPVHSTPGSAEHVTQPQPIDQSLAT